MENTTQPPPPVVGVRRELSIDPVKAQGILYRGHGHTEILLTGIQKLLLPIYSIDVYEVIEHYTATVTKKERNAARIWKQRWGFLCKIREVEEEEARKLGMSLEELYRAAACSVNKKPEQDNHRVHVEPSTTRLPLTTSGLVGRRVQYPLERYGKLVRTGRDYPTRPPLAPGQIYDPYKQTMIFLGSVDGDPISHKQSTARCEITDEVWSQPQRLDVNLFKFDQL